MSKIGLDETIQWYDDNAAQYAEAGASYADLDHIQTFASQLPPGARVLDDGCGPGRDARLLSEQGLEVTGLDLSEGLLEVARQSSYPNISYVKGDMRKLQFEDEAFDGVWSNTALLHLETVTDVEQALSEMYRVLQPEGLLHVVVKAQTGDDKTAVVSDKLSGHDRFFQYFTMDELEQLLHNSGFDVTSAKEYSETDTIPHGRPEVRLLWCLGRKSQSIRE